jgi:hypothetical protein
MKKKQETPIHNRYAPQETSFRKWIVQNSISIISLLMLILASYITIRLAPISQDIAIIKQQVSAIEKATETKIDKDEFILVNQRLDRIQTGLDTIIKLHLGVK